MNPPTVRELICDGLGYCCPWCFFQLFPSSSEAALRLGCTKRAVNYEKARTKECAGREPCLREAIPALERVVQKRRQECSDRSGTSRPANPPAESHQPLPHGAKDDHGQDA